jgi:hypothetical protein
MTVPPASSSPRTTTGRARTLVLGSALVFYVLFILRTSFMALNTRYFVLFEDAMISMRYARNLSTGAGLTWNAGEGRVEGYTNLLWTLWMSLAHVIGLPESKISLFIMLTGVVIMVGNGLVAERIARKVSDSPFVALAVLAAVLFDYPLVFWTLRGMEVGAVALALHALLLLALSIETEHHYGKAFAMAAIGAGSVFLRSDTALSVGLFGLYAALVSPKKKRLLTLAIVGGGAGAAAVSHLAFRMKYYGEKLPNTAFLKLEGISLPTRVKRGLFVTLQVLAFHLGIPISLALTALLGREVSVGASRWEPQNRRLLLLLAFVCVQLAYAVYVGGDAWEWMLYANRYTSAAMPALIVLVTALAARVFDRIKAEPDAATRTLARFATFLILMGLVLLVLSGYAKKFPEEGIARTIVFSKKVAAGAVLFLGLGGVVFFAKRGLSARLEGAARALLSGRGALLFALCLWLPSHLEGLSFWAKNNAAQYADEARYSRLGLLLARSTPEKFRIAVVAAGATPYFSDRPTEDMLGKNDTVIAHEKPRGVFSPGHDKWDYQHSLGAQNPSLIVELADVTPADQAYIDGLGFTQLPNGLWLKSSGLQPLYPVALASSFDTDADLEAAFEKVAAKR